MKIPWYWILGICLMIATVVILAAVQTTLWFLVFGRFPAPMFWLIVLVYLSVTRPLWEATMMTYLLSFAVAPFTASPYEVVLVFCLGLMVLLFLIRERVFWGGPTYFMLMVGGASLAAPVLYWLVSRWLDKNPLYVPEIFDWLISGCLTTLFSLPLYRLYQWYDVIASQDAFAEGRVGPR
ncbi:MAG: hypothetical protein ACXVA9_09795 [Bdellovibrionales bacterium]